MATATRPSELSQSRGWRSQDRFRAIANERTAIQRARGITPMPTADSVRSRPVFKNSDISVRDRYTEAPATATAPAATAASVSHDDLNRLAVDAKLPGFGLRSRIRMMHRPCLYL